MYILSVNTTAPQKTVVVAKDNKVLLKKSEADSNESDDPLPLDLIDQTLRELNLPPHDIGAVRIVTPWRSSRLYDETGEWLGQLKTWGRRILQDWTFGAEVRSQIEEKFGNRIEVDLVPEDLSRALYAAHRYPFFSGFLLQLHSRPEHRGLSLWRLAAGKLKYVPIASQDLSIEDFMTELAGFCGFLRPRGLQKFLSHVSLGEPVFAEALKQQWELGENWGRSFHEEYGGARENLDSPVTVRELDLAASAQKFLSEYFAKLLGFLHDTSQPPLMIQTDSAFGEYLLPMFKKLKFLSDVKIDKVSESDAEVLGALTLHHWGATGGVIVDQIENPRST